MLKKEFIKNNSVYNPLLFEDRIYKIWFKDLASKKLTQSKGKNFVILIAPPNITGTLHMGHSLQNIILDILARYKRMKGFNVVWMPGTDHAGIATQNVVEKELKKEGLTRFDIGREAFVKRAWEWRNKYGFTILKQFEKLGLTLTWSKVKFTLDKPYVEQVEKAFLEYFKKGFIYRELRPINFCVRCQTPLSDLETKYKEQNGKLYYVKYFLKNSNNYVLVATTRPETMLGDTALAINPKDSRYLDLIGKTAIIPLINRDIPIIADLLVDPGFGTGVLKVTPAHDLKDYEISLKHGLKILTVIDMNAKMNENAFDFQGLDYLTARNLIVNKLEQLNLLEKIEEIKHNVPFCDRCGTELQILPSKEWFLKMNYLATLAYKAVKSKEVVITPKRFKKLYFNWLKEIRDWCISRKLWWGQQLPVWYCSRNNDNYIVSLTKPKVKCSLCKKNCWLRSEEVFDTWFSSALWPFAILYTKQEKKYYPADIVASARDIINLWIGRMIFSGKFFKGKIPFKTVYIHPTVLTKEGKRMSKSLGTGIDPVELINRYGSDALRFGLIWQLSGHQDMRFDERYVEQGKKFLNKIWNAYRFYYLNVKKVEKVEVLPSTIKFYSYDKKILSSLEKTKAFIEKKINTFEVNAALKKAYDFFWHELCDIYLEQWKKRHNKDDRILNFVMFQTLKILHPFVPHLTQLIFYSFYKDKKALFYEKY
ncbi:MAG: valine--tRNA ligase [Candidatus Parcubacteria bacterium]|nr:MAG: valine--tRNA ligase [Candidatus Parcubacteria bacterium]